MTLCSIYDLPAIYDRVMPPGPCEAFYAQRARESGGPVLELACGTGRLTVPLARGGSDVVGLDLSPAMLARARQRAADKGVNVTFELGDMRSFDLGRRFSLVIVSCNSLAHLTRGTDLRDGLTNIARHLAPAGILAFDVVNPDVRELGRSDLHRLEFDGGAHSAACISVDEDCSYDAIRQLRTLRWRVREAARPGFRQLAPLVLRQFFPQEVPLLLAAAGLKLTERYGDFAGSPLTGDSPNQVCIARRLRRNRSRTVCTDATDDSPRNCGRSEASRARDERERVPRS